MQITSNPGLIDDSYEPGKIKKLKKYRKSYYKK